MLVSVSRPPQVYSLRSYPCFMPSPSSYPGLLRAKFYPPTFPVLRTSPYSQEHLGVGCWVDFSSVPWETPEGEGGFCAGSPGAIYSKAQEFLQQALT